MCGSLQHAWGNSFVCFIALMKTGIQLSLLEEKQKPILTQVKTEIKIVLDFNFLNSGSLKITLTFSQLNFNTIFK